MSLKIIIFVSSKRERKEQKPSASLGFDLDHNKHNIKIG